MNSKMKKLLACLTVFCTMGLGFACGESGDPVDTGVQSSQTSQSTDSSVDASSEEEVESSEIVESSKEEVESSQIVESSEEEVESSEIVESSEEEVESSEIVESSEEEVESSKTIESSEEEVESSEDIESSEEEVESSEEVPVATYTITFVNEDGTLISEATYEEGETVVVPADPTKEADEDYTYTFAGWDKEVVAATENVTYKATYSKTAIEYSVTFKADGVEVGETQKYSVENKEINVPDVPNKEHYTGVWEEYTLVTGDVVVNAVYTPIDYTITFLNGEEVVETVSFNVKDNEKVAPAIPEKTGYTGVWDEYSFATFENQTVSVHYTANTYAITYNANGGSADMETQDVTYGEGYTLATAIPPKSYQEFLGWCDENGNLVASGDAWNIAKDVTLTAKYSKGITFNSMTEVPSWIMPHVDRVNELTLVELESGNKVLQATTKESCTTDAGLYITTEFLGTMFEDSDVEYMAFDIKTNGASTVNGAQYRNGEDSGWVLYDTNQFNTAPTDAFKSYYLPRSVYEGWASKNIASNRFIILGKMVIGGESFYIDNIRPVTADEYIQDFYSFEHGGVRTNNANQPMVYLNSDSSGWQLGISNANEKTAKFTNEIVSDGMRALQFTKYSGVSSILMCGFTDPMMEVAMREAGYVSFDLYVPEGSDAKIVKNGFEWYGALQQGWNTVYEKVYESGDELISFTDTTASTYVIDNFRLLTEDEYNKAKFGFETGGVLRDNNSNDDTANSGWMYYYVGEDKANNKASIQVDEGNGDNDAATLSNVRFATEQAHSGDYSLAFDKKAGYISLGMAADSAMYASMKNGFTFWIYSTTEIDGTLDHILFNGSNEKLNGGEGVKIEANTWTQITVTAADVNSTGRFLILQGATEGTIYIDDLQPLPVAEAE